MNQKYQLEPRIAGLKPGLVERGKIKIGRKGVLKASSKGNKFQLPEKLDHFLITTLERDKDDNNFVKDKIIHDAIGNQQPKEIPIILIYDDIDSNFQCRYACFVGKKMRCTGDGQKAFLLRNENDTEREQIPCPCEKADPNYILNNPKQAPCKINGVLSVMIDKVPVIGGVWKFRTTSYNSVVGILSSLALIKSLSGGTLAGIPLVLKLSPKQVTTPQGQQMKAFVASIEFEGDVTKLQKIGYAIAMKNKTHEIKMGDIDDIAKSMISNDPEDLGDSYEDVIAEFYPEEAEKALLEVAEGDKLKKDTTTSPAKKNAPDATEKPPVKEKTDPKPEKKCDIPETVAPEDDATEQEQAAEEVPPVGDEPPMTIF